MKFIAPLIVVGDIERSKKFYEDILGEKVTLDFGENVTFKGGFAIHLKKHYAGMANVVENSILTKSHNFELYFEEQDFDKFINKLKSSDVKFIHDAVEHPWGQRAVRFYDPDMHIIEVGEPMETVVKRCIDSGMTVEEVATKTMLSADFIKNCL